MWGTPAISVFLNAVNTLLTSIINIIKHTGVMFTDFPNVFLGALLDSLYLIPLDPI